MTIHKSKKIIFAGTFLLLITFLVALFLFFNSGYVNCSPAENQLPRIAHAGGGYRSWIYTNSIDALDSNRDHYDLFELDFNITSDNEIVCIHDWKISTQRTFGVQLNAAPSSEEFSRLVKNNQKYENCTLASLIKWLEKNPDKRIVTDVKYKNLFVLAEISTKYSSFKDRFIPQIYNPGEYAAVRSLGFKDIIFTIYRYNKLDSIVLLNAQSMDLFALTMPADRAKKLAPRAKCMGMSTYAHTINSDEELHELKKHGIDEIYTDWLKAY
jgi:glycerophosphoryl diester phosphodiesterase